MVNQLYITPVITFGDINSALPSRKSNDQNGSVQVALNCIAIGSDCVCTTSSQDVTIGRFVEVKSLYGSGIGLK